MTPSRPVKLFHFTHLGHLPTILEHGLLPDADGRTKTHLRAEAGDPSIKDRRRNAPVPRAPGTVVADYVPFYFAPRSPMLFSITKGGVPTFLGRPTDLVYLVTTVEHLLARGHTFVMSDRNAAKQVAEFRTHEEDWAAEGFIDWPLMEATMWKNTDDAPDRMERRQAECLVPHGLAWADILAVGVADVARRDAVISAIGHWAPPRGILVRPRWYF